MRRTDPISQYRFVALALLAVSALTQSCSLVSRPASDAVVPPAPAVKEGALGKPTLKPVSIGKASWYGPGFLGKKTASGDIFDDAKFTAAHKSLPLGSKAKVTNLSNGKSVQVEINDRGPFAGGRIIDLSHAAARALGMVDGGVANVRVELITDESGGGGVD